MRVGITGHQQIPAVGREWIEHELRSLIGNWPALIGVSSLAKGADQLFAQCILAAGNALEAVIPCHDYASTFDLADAAAYAELLARASAVTTLDFASPSEDAFLAAGRYIVGDVDLLVAIWDGEPAQGQGGTADIVGYAHRIHRPVTILWPPGVGAHGTSG